jgi:hypothetical protein
MRCIWRVKIKADLLKLSKIRLCTKRYIAASCFGIKEVEFFHFTNGYQYVHLFKIIF